MTAYNKTKHDIGIVNVGTDGSGTTETGLMLVREEGAPVFAEFDGKYLADQFFTNTPSQQYTNPEQEIIIYQDNFTKGFGQYVEDDNNKYHKSFGMDLSAKGQAMAGWSSTAVTLPTITATDETNLDWETWSDASTPGTWTEDLALTREGTVQHGGTYCAKVNFPTATWTLACSQSVTWNTEYQSSGFLFRGWGRCSVDFGGAATRGIKFAIYDGVSRTYSGVVADNDADTWAQSTWAVKYMAAAATELTLEVWIASNGAGADFYWDDMEFIDPVAGAITAMCEHSGAVYFSFGNTVFYVQPTTGIVTNYSTYPTTITDLTSFTVTGGSSYLFVALGVTEACWYDRTQSTLSNNKFIYFASVNTTVSTLYGSTSNAQIRSTPNPINGGTAWSDPATVVGESSYNITGLFSKAGALYIAKEDMPYYLDGSGNVQRDLAPELNSARATTSGKNSHIWQNNIYYPAGDQALLEIGTSNTFIQPSKYGIDIAEFSGRIHAVASDEEWLFIAVDNSTKIEIMKGRWETVDGNTEWVWHPFHELTLEGCEAMLVSNSYQKRLYLASTVSSGELYYLPLPTKYGDITSDSNASFKTATYFETSYMHGNFPQDTKGFIKMSMELGHVYNANIYFTGHYKKIGDSSWTSIGDFKGTSANRVASAYIPVDGSSNKPSSTKMKFKITTVTNDTSKTPILLNYKVSAVLFTTIRRIIYCKVMCAEEMLCRNGLKEKNRADVITTIDNLRNATYPVTIHDIHGTSRTVRYLPLSSSMPKYHIARDENGFEKERHYNLMLLEVIIS